MPSPTDRSRGRSPLSRGAREGPNGAFASLSRTAGEGASGQGLEAGEGLSQDPVVDKIVAHVARVAAGEVPAAARRAAKVFIADSFGVGIAGAAAPWRGEVLDMAAAPGGEPQASVWGSGERLPVAAAAM